MKSKTFFLVIALGWVAPFQNQTFATQGSTVHTTTYESVTGWHAVVDWSCAIHCVATDQYSVPVETNVGAMPDPASVSAGYCGEQGGVDSIVCTHTPGRIRFEQRTTSVPTTTFQTTTKTGPPIGIQ